jgi:hypothetical protein
VSCFTFKHASSVTLHDIYHSKLKILSVLALEGWGLFLYTFPFKLSKETIKINIITRSRGSKKQKPFAIHCSSMPHVQQHKLLSSSVFKIPILSLAVKRLEERIQHIVHAPIWTQFAKKNLWLTAHLEHITLLLLQYVIVLGKWHQDFIHSVFIDFAERHNHEGKTMPWWSLTTSAHEQFSQGYKNDFLLLNVV